MSSPIVSHSAATSARWCILVHGGAGNVAPERRALHSEGCRKAVLAAAEVLRGGGNALDAVEMAVRALEDDPLYNAGTGACLNADGRIELDASIMEGRALRAGGVAALPAFLEPISIARAALEDGRHVLYGGEGALRFARQKGFHPVEDARLVTESARAVLEQVRAGGGSGNWSGGTVGAVARDATGLTAAGTSTGGMVNKHVGRIGDSPLIGAGTYADDEAGAASTTGAGEQMIRLGVARLATDLMRSGASAHDAAREAITRLSVRLSSTGGIITVDRTGGCGLARSTDTMSWACATDLGDDAGI
jgi:L-asparaginase / beta-aspartyl-peptidase